LFVDFHILYLLKIESNNVDKTFKFY